MSWTIEEINHAGHTITVKYKPWSHELVADIRGPRAGSGKRKIYAGDVTWKINSRIPFMSPPVNKIERQVHPIWKKAAERIDQAIAEYHKKREDDYQ